MGARRDQAQLVLDRLKGLSAAYPRLMRWARRAAAAVAVTTLLAGMVVWGYVASTDLPPDPVPPQASVLYYRDGATVLARIGATDRTDVAIDAVPEPVRQAFIAAEDRDFYTHHGVSVTGIGRAAWANVTGGAGQGGASTITQQYVRNAYLSQHRSIYRKAKEATLAVKLERRYSKNEILERYLNTIYFGRNAYGIQSAAQAYFGTTVDRLDATRGAVLAALIKDPHLNDPAVDAGRALSRWRWILRAMVGQGALPAETAETAAYPRVADRSVTAEAVGGPLGLIADQVESELRGYGISAQTVRTGGLHVATTIDVTAQRAALDVVERALKNRPAQLRAALVALDPGNGAVRAYYGGTQGRGFYDDAMAPRPPASTFKPIVLAAAVRRGWAYQSLWDGSSPRQFKDRQGVPLENRDDVQCPVCPLDEAMVGSLNTPYYALAEEVGPAQVRKVAVDLGIPERYGQQRTLVDLKGEPMPGRTRADIALGRYPVRPADLATVYGTLAAGGVRHDRHVVQAVADRDGEPLTVPPRRGTRVLPAAVAADVTATLAKVAARGGAPGRAAAAKTGTQQWQGTRDSQDAWTAGYTPQLAAVTWVGAAKPGPIRESDGTEINGNGLPYALWRDFLTAALAGTPATPLPQPANVGRRYVGDITGKAAPPPAPRGGDSGRAVPGGGR